MLKQDFFALMMSKQDFSKIDHWKKCLVLYRFLNLKLFHPEQRNFDRTDMRILYTDVSQTIFDTDFSGFEIT